MRQRNRSVVTHHDHHTHITIIFNAPLSHKECEMLKEKLGSVCQVEQKQQADATARSAGPQTQQIEFFHYIDPNVDDEEQQARLHRQIVRLVSQHSIQDICARLHKLRDMGLLLLPQNVRSAYDELVRMGMPTDKPGFNYKTFEKYY
jgi:hypothetical protein